MFTEKEKHGLRTYQYKGADTSYIYRFVLSPLAQRCVDLTPTWVAPNLITLTGLLVVMVAVGLHLVYNPTLDGAHDPPRWIYLANSIALFVYQTMDNMDGKQARKTGSASPLGLLFDHGCDALNAGFNTINTASILALGCSPRMLYGFFTAMVPFFFATWEEFYLGEMILPVINGPTEGLLIAMAMGLATFAFGPGLWHEPTGLPVTIPVVQAGATPTPVELVYTATFLGALATVTGQVAKVLRHVASKPDDGRGDTPLKAIMDVVPFALGAASAAVWTLKSEVAFQQYPVATCALISVAFVEMVLHIMLQHLCHAPTKPWQRVAVLPLVVMAVKVCFPDVLPVSEAELLCGMSGVMSGFLVYTLVRVCIEVADVLQIYVLRIGKRKGA